MAIKISGTTVVDDSRNLVNLNSGAIVGVQSGGNVVGAGATTLNFIGAGNTFYYNAGTKTLDVSIQGGGAESTIDKQTFNVGVAGTNLVTLTNPYTSGNIDVFLNGLKLIPTTDYTETSSNVITLATAAVNGDVIETISFRSVSITNNAIGIQSGGVSVGSTITTLNFIGAGNTFLDRGNGIIDISIQGGGGIGIQSAGSVIGSGITTLNFIGAGNTFRVTGGTVDVSISGGGSGVSTSGITTSAIFSNFGTIYENQDLGQTGYNYFAAGPLAITASVTVGAGNTFVVV
jgi:hypothetical protein